MDREDLKNYLPNQEWIEGEIELYKEQKTLAEGLKSPTIDGMPKAKNKLNYAIEELMDKLNEILEYLNEQQEKQNLIIKQLGKMTNATYRLILFYKYIQGYKLEEVAVKLKRDYKYICNLHGYALNEFDKLQKI